MQRKELPSAIKTSSGKSSSPLVIVYLSRMSTQPRPELNVTSKKAVRRWRVSARKRVMRR